MLIIAAAGCSNKTMCMKFNKLHENLKREQMILARFRQRLNEIGFTA